MFLEESDEKACLKSLTKALTGMRDALREEIN